MTHLAQSTVPMAKFALDMGLAKSLRVLILVAKATFVEAVCVMKGIWEMIVPMDVQHLREMLFLVQGTVSVRLWVAVLRASVNLDGLDLPVQTEPVFLPDLFSSTRLTNANARQATHAALVRPKNKKGREMPQLQ